MKVTLQSDTLLTEKELTYPVLMEGVYENNERKLIVRFSDASHGMCIYDSNNYFDTFKNIAWIRAGNKTQWKRFEGKLILEN